MKGADGGVLYVGKAKNIKKRVGSYFHKKAHDNKTQSLVNQVTDIEVTITANEVEALLLENSLIKELRPPYNIIFRDDKSYPYVAISQHQFPRLFLHRGEKKKGFKYFGPYPNVKDLRETIELLQKVFQIRQCEDSYFANRTRPCLQYQIDRCSAPCVKKISKVDYADDVKSTLLFLKGKANVVIDELVKDMESAAGGRNFERAAKIRNQIQSLRLMNQHQRVFLATDEANTDVISYSMTKEYICFHTLIVRNGAIIGSRQYLSKLPLDVEINDIFIRFLLQNYSSVVEGNILPSSVVIPKNITIEESMIEYISQKVSGDILIRHIEGNVDLEWEKMARSSAKHAIKSKTHQDESYIRKIEALEIALDSENIERIICFDVSHLQGTNTIASCVVYGVNGAIKESYRRFKINPKVGGDDYFGIYDAVKRYLLKVHDTKLVMPDVILIDGGQGQVNSAYKAIEEIGISEGSIINVVGISKGPERKAGEESIIFNGRSLEQDTLLPGTPAFLLLQEIRDEAHRFAISGHRKLRGNYQTKSFLEGVNGIGPKKRQDLLKYFGGLRGIMSASVAELAQVPGISSKLAERLFSELHSDIE